ncbi:MAG: hypothetical protein QXW80_04245 [Candidatus Micrarchaeia archaeon]
MKKPEELTAKGLFDETKLKNLEKDERNALEKLIQQMSYVNNKDFTNSVREFFKSNKGEIKFTGIFTASELESLEKGLDKLGYKLTFSIISSDDGQIQKWYKYTNRDPASDVKNFINFMNGGSVAFELSTGKETSKEPNIKKKDDGLQYVVLDISSLQKKVDNAQSELEKLKSGYEKSKVTTSLDNQYKEEVKKEVIEQQSDGALQKALNQIKNIQVEIGGKPTKLGEIPATQSKLKELEEGLGEGKSLSFTMKENSVMMDNLKEIAKYWAGKNVKEEKVSNNKYKFTGEGGSYEVKYENGKYIITRLQFTQVKEEKQETQNIFSEELIINGINFNKVDTDGKYKIQKLLEGREVEYSYKNFLEIKDTLLKEINRRTGRTYKYAEDYPNLVPGTTKYRVKLELVSDEKSDSSSTQPPAGMQKTNRNI